MTTTNLDDVECQRSLITARYGHDILVDCWVPGGSAPAAVVQVLHGLGEHIGRYDRFARECAANDLAVIAHNHRGHGETCDVGLLGHIADDGGWDKLLADTDMVRQRALDRFPGVPLVLFGHSMGSYVAQSAMMRDPAHVDALILSASTLASRMRVRAGRLLSRIEAWRTGGRSRSPLLNRLGLGDFNRPFAPNRTAFDWLSRDEREVDRYVADPLCGADCTNRFWYDLTGGLLEISSKRALRSVPRELPILIFGGERDPVGGASGLARLARAYEAAGHGDVTLRVYDGGRHEMLNEINRDEVTTDVIAWIESKSRA